MGDSTNADAVRLRTLSDLAREFSSSTEDYDALLQLVARRLADMFGDLCVVRLVGDDGLFLESPAAIHHPNPDLVALGRSGTQVRQRVGEGISGRLIATGIAALVPVVDAAAMLANLAPERRAAVEQQNITSLIVVPLLARGRALGVVSLTRSDASRPLTEADLHVMQDVASHASLAIANAKAYAAERAAHAALLQSNRALHESEEAHRLLFEASPLPLLVFDVETLRCVAINEEALNLYGYTREE